MSDTYRDRVHAELSDLTYRGVQMSPAEAAIYTKAVLAIRDDELARVRSELADTRREIDILNGPFEHGCICDSCRVEAADAER